MHVRLGKLSLALSFWVILALAEAAIAQVAELPIEREWGIKMAEPVQTIRMADIDKDGIDEILVGTGDDSGYVYVINGITQEVLWKSPGLMGRALSVEVGDADGGDTKEIIVGTGRGISDSGNVYVFDGLKYTLKWHKNGFDERIYSIAIGDFDMDDSTEILLGTFYDWEYERENPWWVYDYEKKGNLYVLDGHTYCRELRLSTDVMRRMKIIDIDEDGINETLTGKEYDNQMYTDFPGLPDNQENRVRILLRRGSIWLDTGFLFNYYGEPRYSSRFLEMAVGNCDSYCTREIICSYFVDEHTYVFAGLKVLDGVSLNLKWSRDDTSTYWHPNVINGLAIADLNKDGINDIVAAYSDGHIKVIDGVTSVDSAVSPQTIPISSFAFGNVDDDEESEACISNGDSLILLEVHSFTAVENKDRNSPNIPPNYKLLQNYPNPFNPLTLVRYQLPAISYQRSAVSLKVYNILGQEVRTLVDGEQAPGYYSVRWDGRDSLGKQVSRGVYFYRLKAEGYTKARKMVLIR